MRWVRLTVREHETQIMDPVETPRREISETCKMILHEFSSLTLSHSPLFVPTAFTDLDVYNRLQLQNFIYFAITNLREAYFAFLTSKFSVSNLHAIK